MSIDATRWAWMQSVKPASLKLLLLSLADRADGVDFRCYPSIDRVSLDTGLDRKTVMRGFKQLEDIGLISRLVRPGAGNIYQLVGVEDRYSAEPSVHFVYRTEDTETGEFYIGAHTTIDQDDRYLGSGRWVSLHPKKSNLKRTIMQHFESRADALKAEIEILDLCLEDPLCRNLRAERGNLAQASSKRKVPKTVLSSPSPESGTKSRKRDRASPENGTAQVPKTGHEPINNLPVEEKSTPSGLDLSILPETLSPDLWRDFVVTRKGLKKPITSQTAVKGIARELHACEAEGISSDVALTVAIEKSWLSLKPSWVKKALLEADSNHEIHRKPSSYPRTAAERGEAFGAECWGRIRAQHEAGSGLD